MTRPLFLLLALSGAAFGQMTWQQCQDNATTELNNCVAAAQKTFDTQKATDLANYNDCIDPNSPVRRALPGATGAATLRTILASIDATSSSSGSPLPVGLRPSFLHRGTETAFLETTSSSSSSRVNGRKTEFWSAVERAFHAQAVSRRHLEPYWSCVRK